MITAFAGPQFIVDSDGRSLTLSITNESLVVSHPFHGRPNQQWLVEVNNAGNVALMCQYRGTYVWPEADRKDVELFANDMPFFWEMSENGVGYKIVSPATDLALCLGNTASMRPKNEQGTQLFFLPSTPQNGEAINQRQMARAETTVAIRRPNAGENGDVSVTINEPSVSSSNGARNFVINVGSHQMNPPAHSFCNSSSINNFPVLTSNAPTAHGFSTGYFRIRASGTEYYWSLHCWESSKDGNMVVLWNLEKGRDSNVFFVNPSGALCCLGGGVAIDVIGDTLVVAHNRSASTLESPNPWTHPLPTFSYSRAKQTISVKFHSDPLVSATWPRPDSEWKDKEFFVSARCTKGMRVPRYEELAQWAPNSRHYSNWTTRAGDVGKPGAWNNVGVEENDISDPERFKWVLEWV